MMTSSGSGPYRVGGLGPLSSSLSSNLSPLAPPFEVDKSLQKQNSTNTSVNYPDVLTYGPYFDRAGQLWKHSSSSVTGSKFGATEPMGINATCSSSPTIYGYSGSQPSTTVASVYAATSGSTAAYDPFSYDPFPNSISTAPEEGVKPYYSPYISPPPRKDGFLSLGVSNGDGFDMLSNSASAHLSDCGSSAANHPQQRIWDGDHKLNWGGFWSGVNEQSKWSEYAQGFVSKDSNLSDPMSCKTSFIVDGSNKSQPSIDVHTHPFIDGISNTNVPDAGNSSNPRQGLGLTSPVSDGCFDIFGGAYHPGSRGIDQRDSRSLLGFLRLPDSVSSSIPEESSHLKDPVVESVTNFCGSEKGNGLTQKDHFSQSGRYVFGCTSKASTFPVTKNKSPYGEVSSSAEGIFSAPKPYPKVSVADKESNVSAGYDYSYPVELRLPLGSKRPSNIIIRRPSSSSVMPSSSQIGDSLDSRIGSKKGCEKSQVSPRMSNQFSSVGFDLEVNDTQAASSIEKLSGATDVHNPAEDSPCWRGASSSNFSPFMVSEAMVPDVYVKKLDECKGLSTHAPQIKNFIVNTSGCGGFFAEKVKDGNSSERPLVSEWVSKGNEKMYSTIQQPLCVDLNIGDGLQFADESYASTKECCILNISETDALPGMQISEADGSDRSGKYPPAVANSSLDAPSSSENNHVSSPLGDNASLKHCQETCKISDSNIDVNMLLKTLSDLSEMLRCYYFSKRASVSEQYSIAIKHIIANLNASMLMMAGETSSTMPSSEVNDAAFETVAAAVKLGGTAEGLLDSVSCKDDPNTIGDVDMTVAIKKILHENFLGEEEMDRQKLLYKSLWLDAEASLCAMTAKTRFLRVKAEMERTHDGAEDKEISSTSNISGDVHGTVELANQNNHTELSEVNKRHIKNMQAVDVNTMEFQGPKATQEKTRFLSSHASRQGNAGNGSVDSGSTSHANNVEDSVMARYQIPKSRIESFEAPIQESEETSGGHKDSLGTGTTSDKVRAYNPVLAKYQLLECRANRDFLNSQCYSSPSEYNYLSDRDPLSPIYQILECGDDDSDSLHKSRTSQNSQRLSNLVDVHDDGEASVMSRFRIIQSRVQDSDSVDEGQIVVPPLKVVEDDPDELGLSEQQNQAVRSAFGPYPDFTENEQVNQFGVPDPMVRETYLTQLCKTNRLNGGIFESWYANDCSSSDWEHVSKEDLRRTN